MLSVKEADPHISKNFLLAIFLHAIVRFLSESIGHGGYYIAIMYELIFKMFGLFVLFSFHKSQEIVCCSLLVVKGNSIRGPALESIGRFLRQNTTLKRYH